jgi:Arc/MetJ-type ribon-helix-helix transcriptional regulator
MVSFRLSEEEYANLRSMCETGEARSVSDLARDAVHRLIQPDSHAEMTAALRALEGRVDRLDLQVQRLTTASDQSALVHQSGPARRSNGEI